MRLVLASIAALAFLQSSSTHPAPAGSVNTTHLTAATSAEPFTSAAATRLFIDITPKPKMHVYAPGETDGIPIEIRLDANPAIKAGKPVFPPPQKYFFPPLKLTQLVYSSPFRITLPITIVPKPPTGSLTITGTLHYQACDDAVCYVPKAVAVKWMLKNGNQQ